ncbi:DUF3999 family protein [Paucibacter sp. AS339]|uniref:DUF3999 family protein n=1 Tax=Paucibacter hankyongi TaxID=3133434 RepID=UPI0030998243
MNRFAKSLKGVLRRLRAQPWLLGTLLMAMGATATAAESRPALEEQPRLYAATAPIRTAPAEGLQRLSLPWAVVQASRSPGLADLRIFDAQGQVLPMAWAKTAPAAEQQRELSLARFAWPEAPTTTSTANELQVKLQLNGDGTLLSLQALANGSATSPKFTPNSASNSPRLAKRWLLDLSALQSSAQADERISQLKLDWRQREGGLSTHLRVEASQDAQQWHALTEARLLDLPAEPQAALAGAAGGFSIKSLSWPVNAGTPAIPRYLRLQFDTALNLSRSDITLSRSHGAAAPQARSVRFEPVARSSESAGQPPQWTADLQGRFAPLALSVQLPELNSLLNLRLEQRNRDDEPWRPVSQFVAWRLLRAGVESSAPAHTLQAEPARYWRLLGDATAGPLAAQPLTLQWQWQAPQLVLLARGAKPQGSAQDMTQGPTSDELLLAVGRDAATPLARPLSGLIPGYQAGDEFKLPEAQLGALQPQPKPGMRERLAQLVRPGPEALRRGALWAVLILSVIGLGWMARRLRKQTSAHHQGR